MDYKELLEFDDYAMDMTIRMVHHNSAMEGNNLTLGDTMSILIDRKTPIKSVSLDEVHEIENYRNFVPLILEFLERDKVIDEHLIGHFHSVLIGIIKNCQKIELEKIERYAAILKERRAANNKVR
ncbi:hypothetical protein [Helicobacter pylori]|uniref:hypothetical protein n=1 Tax=Helicobacter pylori TaxID=210 RepID=UPI0030C1A8F6